MMVTRPGEGGEPKLQLVRRFCESTLVTSDTFEGDIAAGLCGFITPDISTRARDSLLFRFFWIQT